MKKLEATPYHENTKLARRYFGGVRKHEGRGGFIKRQVLFRAFQISCFRGEVLFLVLLLEFKEEKLKATPYEVGRHVG